MIQTVDIIGDLVSQIDTTIDVTNVQVLGDDTYKLTVCNTSYLNTKFSWEIEEDKTAIVTAFVFNESVTIKVVGFVPTEQIYTLPMVNYFHGTINAIFSKDERANIKWQSGKKYPFVYLLERMIEKLDKRPSSIIDRESPLKMFFLTNFDKGKAKTNHQYEEIIKPMSNVLEKFILLLEENEKIADLEDLDITNYVEFGTYIDTSGNIKNITGEAVSGQGLEGRVKILKDYNCKNNGCM